MMGGKGWGGEGREGRRGETGEEGDGREWGARPVCLLVLTILAKPIRA